MLHPVCNASLHIPPLDFKIMHSVSDPGFELVSNISAIPPELMPIIDPFSKCRLQLSLEALTIPIIVNKSPITGIIRIAFAAIPRT